MSIAIYSTNISFVDFYSGFSHLVLSWFCLRYTDDTVNGKYTCWLEYVPSLTLVFVYRNGRIIGCWLRDIVRKKWDLTIYIYMSNDLFVCAVLRSCFYTNSNISSKWKIVRPYSYTVLNKNVVTTITLYLPSCHWLSIICIACEKQLHSC